MEKFIKSLHRPYNSRLKTCLWVCDFAKKKKDLARSKFSVEFYKYLIAYLYRLYEENNNLDSEGLPSVRMVMEVYNHLSNFSNCKQNEIITSCIGSDASNIDSISKHIFSTYKAASYYINFAKNVLKLIDDNNILTSDGLLALKMRRHNVLTLSRAERSFFTRILVKEDLMMLTLQVAINRFEKKYKLSNQEKINYYLDFINNYAKSKYLKRFNYTTTSIANYMVVRTRWLKDLDWMSKSNYLKPNVKTIIVEGGEKSYFEAICRDLNEFENKTVKPNYKLRQLKKDFIKTYKSIIDYRIINDFKYVNLYDIKDEIDISYNKLQDLLLKLENDREYKYKLHFNNILHSIDLRKRFFYKKRPVINVKISGD